MNTEGDFIYLFVRTPYVGEMSRELYRLKAKTVLAWFQKGWDLDYAPETELKHPRLALEFPQFFEEAQVHNLPRPETAEELRQLLEEHLRLEGEMWFDGITLSILNDDDEFQYAYYFFEPRYAQAHPEHVQFLLTDTKDWPPSPAEANPLQTFQPKAARLLQLKKPDGSSGTVYGYFSNYYDCLGLDDDNGFQIEGIRLSEFLDFLKLPQTLGEIEEWLPALALLRTFIESSDTDLPTVFNRVDPYWRDACDLAYDAKKAGIPLTRDSVIAKCPDAKASSKSRVIFNDPHCFIFCSFIGSYYEGETQNYFQMILFDDVWASANENLAQSILFYAQGWNGLGMVMTKNLG